MGGRLDAGFDQPPCRVSSAPVVRWKCSERDLRRRQTQSISSHTTANPFLCLLYPSTHTSLPSQTHTGLESSDDLDFDLDNLDVALGWGRLSEPLNHEPIDLYQIALSV